jgi:hypothetical protein
MRDTWLPHRQLTLGFNAYASVRLSGHRPDHLAAVPQPTTAACSREDLVTSPEPITIVFEPGRIARRWLVAVVLVAGTVVAPVLGSSGDPASGSRARPDQVAAVPASVAARAERVLSALFGTFDAFVEPLISATPVRSALGTWLARGHGLAHVDADPALATYLAPLPDGLAAWAVPGADGVCLELVATDGRATGACGSVAFAKSGRIVTTIGASGAVRLVGFVPDSNRWVRIVGGAGRSESARVTNNVWMALVGAGDSYSLSVRDAAGAEQTFRLSIPFS